MRVVGHLGNCFQPAPTPLPPLLCGVCCSMLTHPTATPPPPPSLSSRSSSSFRHFSSSLPSVFSRMNGADQYFALDLGDENYDSTLEIGGYSGEPHMSRAHSFLIHQPVKALVRSKQTHGLHSYCQRKNRTPCLTINQVRPAGLSAISSGGRRRRPLPPTRGASRRSTSACAGGT